MKTLLSFSFGLIFTLHSLPAWSAALELAEPARNMPVLEDVDVVVVGGSSAGVAAAVAAAEAGARVFLAAPRPYLGEDLCATYRLWLEPGEVPTTELAKALFESESKPPPQDPVRPVKPMQIKRLLDHALLQAEVPFLYNSPPTEVLHDTNGYPAGVLIANRSGRQAVLGRVIIDATEQATVARLAHATFSDFPEGKQTFRRITVGGSARKADNLNNLTRTPPLRIQDRAGKSYPVHEYELELALPTRAFASFAAAEQLARDLTWTPGTIDGSETLFHIPRDPVQAKRSFSGEWLGADRIPLDVFRPANHDQLFVLGPCADVSREVAAILLRPVQLLAVGERVGQAAAALARSLPKPSGVHLSGEPPRNPAPGVVREIQPHLTFRSSQSTIPAENRSLPVWGQYDVIVVGGGTGGAPAGIAAGRQGAKTLVLEFLHGLGGVGTMGLISSYYHGNRVGFTSEIDQGVAAFGPKNSRTTSRSWNPEHKIEFYRRALREADVEIWYGVLGAGAVVENGQVRGVVAVTPEGRGVLLARVVIDATGNADIAAAAGADCRYIDESHVAVQGTGLPPKELGARYTNTDYTFVDDNDIFDIWRVLVTAKQKFKGAYDLGQLIDTRERRQIIGDFTLSPMDMMLRRTYPDTIVIARSNFDTHGFTVHPLFLLRPPDRKDIDVRVPYRCLLPRGLDGILVTGLGVSAHRDAIPVIRMQADIQNQGYAAGVAAAMIARANSSTRQLDVKALQRHLVDKGNLPQPVLTETDSFPLPKSKVAAAVKNVTGDYRDLEVVLAQFDTAQPILREAFKQTEDPNARLIYAHILGVMGDPLGATLLAETVASVDWDKGWRYTGMGQYGFSMSQLDSYIVALGRTRSPKALAPLLDKAHQLNPKSEFSHFRALAIALESLADPAAAQPLARLLSQPGIRGHAVPDIKAALHKNPGSHTDTSTRNQALTELVLARALYRCGDHEGMGEAVLHRYAEDLHGHYARHAKAVLAARSGAPGPPSRSLYKVK